MSGYPKVNRVERLSPRRLSIVLTSGHKRQIRVMLEKLGYRVQRLLRVRIGSLELGNLGTGKWARLSPAEIELLLRNPPARKPSHPPRPAKSRTRPQRKRPQVRGGRKRTR